MFWGKKLVLNIPPEVICGKLQYLGGAIIYISITVIIFRILFYFNLNCSVIHNLYRSYVTINFFTGNFTKIDDVHTINQCVMFCCQNEYCNVALMNNFDCYHIACISDEFCLPIPSPKSDAIKHVSLVLVKPVLSDETWWDVLNDNFDVQDKNQISREMLEHLLNVDQHNFNDNYINDMLMGETKYDTEYTYKQEACDVGINTMCATNEECVQVVPKSRAGLCKCKEGYSRTNGVCSPNSFKDDYVASRLTDRIMPVNTTDTDVVNKKQLTVSVRSKEVSYIFVFVI